ncbi:hypothetical protein RI367_003602 [Sorochytrium milnesiophthora]
MNRNKSESSLASSTSESAVSMSRPESPAQGQGQQQAQVYTQTVISLESLALIPPGTEHWAAQRQYWLRHSIAAREALQVSSSSSSSSPPISAASTTSSIKELMFWSNDKAASPPSLTRQRATVKPEQYSGIYDQLIRQRRPLATNKSLPLPTLVEILVAGWKEEGLWNAAAEASRQDALQGSANTKQ